jgi:hypothetical protein
MKKTLSFLFVALPLGLLLSLILAVILGAVTFCRSFADYWSYIIVQFFPMYDASDDRDEPEEPKKELTMWEKHQLRLDANKNEKEDNTKSN